MKPYITLLMMCLVVGSVGMQAQIPNTISMQGQLFQQNGDPMPDGDYPVVVSLHVGAQSDDNIVVCNPCTVTFRSGVFTLVLGDSSSPLPPMDRQYWMQISVNGEALQPRLALHSVPYALSAPGGVPIGSIMPFAGPADRVPDGWMVCDGRAMSSKATPKLYEAIAQTWGDGDDDGDALTDFNLPDLQGMYLRGADDGTRDQYAYARIREAPILASKGYRTLGTYHGQLDGFDDGPFLDEIQNNNMPSRLSMNPTSARQTARREAAVNTPNAAVLYIIRVR